MKPKALIFTMLVAAVFLLVLTATPWHNWAHPSDSGTTTKPSRTSTPSGKSVPDSMVTKLLAQRVEADWDSLELPKPVQGKFLMNTERIPQDASPPHVLNILVLGTPNMPSHGDYTFSSPKERADQLNQRELLLAFGYVKDEVEIPPPWRWMLDAYADYYFKHRSSPASWHELLPQLGLSADAIKQILALPSEKRLGPHISPVSGRFFDPFAKEFSPGDGWLQVITEPKLVKTYLKEIEQQSSVVWSEMDTALVYARVYGESGVILEGVYPIGRVESKEDVPVRAKGPITTGRQGK